jgi:hypothetical protein
MALDALRVPYSMKLPRKAILEHMSVRTLPQHTQSHGYVPSPAIATSGHTLTPSEYSGRGRQCLVISVPLLPWPRL